MSENNTIVLSDAAARLVKSDVTAFKSDGKRYAAYIAEMGVTLDTVAAHVAIFREAFKASTKSATPEQVKAYATKVRNGLNYNLGKTSTKSEPTALLTGLGVAADLEDVIAAWHASQS